MGSLQAYLNEVRAALRPALCLHTFPSQHVERHMKPEVETRASPEVLLQPVEIKRREAPTERCLIEQSINSTRISFSFKTADAVEEKLAGTFLRFMMHRAEQLDLVRRVPVEGYAISFLITSTHLERYHRERLIDFLCQFVEDFHAELCAMKLSLATRNRALVARFWELAEQQQQQAAKRGPGAEAVAVCS